MCLSFRYVSVIFSFVLTMHTGFLQVIYSMLNASVILKRNEAHLKRNETGLEGKETCFETNKMHLTKNEMRW